MLYTRGTPEKLNSFFTSTEFDCRCKLKGCKETRVNYELVNLLTEIRKFVGKPIFVISGYRCSDRQEQIRTMGLSTSKGISQHELGNAADIMCQGLSGDDLERIARTVGFESVGVAEKWIHVDTRTGYRRWEYGPKD